MKRQNAEKLASRIPRFPSSTEDGSIEAQLDDIPLLVCDTFPSSTEDGSIEALPPSWRCTACRKFPSSTEDGSIEAGSSALTVIMDCRGFRPQLRTAPLKLLEVQQLQADFGLFPSSTEDGSIEARPTYLPQLGAHVVSVLN